MHVIVSRRDQHLVKGKTVTIDDKGYPRVGRTRLHKLILPHARIVDHVNRIKTDCRRKNLREVTRSQNAANSKHRSHNTSGYRGVHKCKSTGRWRVCVTFNGRTLKFKRFDNAVDAAREYDRQAKRLHGKFAVTNKKLGLL